MDRFLVLTAIMLALCMAFASADFNFYYDFPSSGNVISSNFSDPSHTFSYVSAAGSNGALKCNANSSREILYEGLFLLPYEIQNNDLFVIEYKAISNTTFGYWGWQIVDNEDYLGFIGEEEENVSGEQIIMFNGEIGGSDTFNFGLNGAYATSGQPATYIPLQLGSVAPDNTKVWWVHKFINGFNANGTMWIAGYVNNTFIGNLSLGLNYSNFEIANATNFALQCVYGSAQYYNYMDWLNITVTSGAEANTAPVVVITAPPNDTTSGSQQNITFTSTDTESATTDCSLYIDDVLEDNDPTVANATSTVFSPLWTTGAHQYYIECTDGEDIGSSGTYTFTFNSSHAIILFNPLNDSSSTAQEVVSYEVYDSDHSTTSCSLYIDTLLNMSNATVLNDTVSSFTPVWTGTHDWYIECDDGFTTATSQTRTFTFLPCVPNWQCTSYASCNTSNLAACNAVTDLNTCGEVYAGDYSEFPAQACDYCARSVVLVNASNCVNGSNTNCYLDNNFATCCNVTGLGSDCIGDTPQSQATVCLTESCSMFYTDADISRAAVDAIVKFLLAIGALGVIAVIVAVFVYGRRYIK